MDLDIWLCKKRHMVMQDCNSGLWPAEREGKAASLQLFVGVISLHRDRVRRRLYLLPSNCWSEFIHLVFYVVPSIDEPGIESCWFFADIDHYSAPSSTKFGFWCYIGTQFVHHKFFHRLKLQISYNSTPADLVVSMRLEIMLLMLPQLDWACSDVLLGHDFGFSQFL